MFVLESAFLNGHCGVACYSQPEDMQPWLLSFPEAAAPTAKPVVAQCDVQDVPDAVLAEHPWVRKYMKCGSGVVKYPAVATAPAEEDPGDEEHPFPEVVQQAWDQLSGDAHDVNQGMAGAGNNFFYRFSLSHRRAGMGYDLLVTEPRKGNPRFWCRQYARSQTVSFSVAKYGDVNSMTMAVEVAASSVSVCGSML